MDGIVVEDKRRLTLSLGGLGGPFPQSSAPARRTRGVFLGLDLASSLRNQSHICDWGFT